MKLANPFSTVSEEKLAKVVRRLAETLRPRAIYLFGSHARGVPRPDSDVDLMVVVDDASVTIEHHRQGYACLRSMGVPAELHFSSRTRFERYADVVGSIQHEIRRKGVLLYAAEA